MSTPFSNFRDTRDARYDCLFLAQVVDNADPSGFGRVKLKVPGLLDPSSVWAFPIGRMFGVKNGVHWVPQNNSNGVLWLNQGDVDHPYFLPGPWGAPDGVSDIPEQAGAGDPNKVVFRWQDFYALVDGTPGAEKVVFADASSGNVFTTTRASGNFARSIFGNETATIVGNLSETVQTGNETHSVTAGSRTTTIGASEATTIGTSRTESIGTTETKTVGAASTETITGVKTITSIVSLLLNAGAAITATAVGAFSATAAGISLNSSGATSNASTGLVTNSFLGGILETVVGAVVRSVTGAITETVSGLWTMVVNGGLLIQGGSIQIGTGNPNGYLKLLNSLYHSTVYMAHTHVAPLGGGATSTPNVPPPSTLSAAETADLTAS